MSRLLIICNIFGAFFYNFAINDLGFRGAYLIHKDQTATLQQIENSTNAGISQESVTTADPVTNALALMFSAIKDVFVGLFNPLKDYVLWLPYMLMSFGIPIEFALGMGGVFWFIQIIGIAQVITGRSFRGLE